MTATFISYYFYYALTSSNEVDLNLVVYNVDDIPSLAEEIPDLSKDFFIAVLIHTRVLEKDK